MRVELIPVWATWLVSIAAAMTAAGIIARKLRNGWAWIHEQLRIVVAELSPNGGKSLADKITRLEANHEEAKEHWLNLHEGQDQLWAAAVDIKDRLETLEGRLGLPPRRQKLRRIGAADPEEEGEMA